MRLPLLALPAVSALLLPALAACASSPPAPSPPSPPTVTASETGSAAPSNTAAPLAVSATAAPTTAAPPTPSAAPAVASTGPVVCKGTALVLLLDRSGSMTGAPFEGTKLAAKAAVAALPAGSCVEVAFFDSAVVDLVPLAPVDSASAAARIDKATPGGGTEFVAALETGAASMRRVQGATKRRVLFLSDGMAPSQGVADGITHIRASGATVSTIALGRDADAALLGKMATDGGGRFYAVTDPVALEKIFVKELAL